MKKENDQHTFEGNFADRPSGAAALHMHIVGKVVELVGHIEQELTMRRGDTPAVRREAASIAFDFFEQTMKLSRSSVRLYVRCHQRFGTSPEAIQHLRLTDMGLLLGADTTDELVAFVVAARKANPCLPRMEVQRLIDGYRRGSASCPGAASA